MLMGSDFSQCLRWPGFLKCPCLRSPKLEDFNQENVTVRVCGFSVLG